MKANYRGSYKSFNKAGVLTTKFRYAVTGTESELVDYKEIQGDGYRADDSTGEPLWFSNKYVGSRVDLNVSAKGNIFADTSVFDQLESLANQHPGVVGEMIVKNELLNMGSLISRTSTVTAPVADKVETEQEKF